MARSEPVAAVILAAGAATRFGRPKQNLLLPTVLRYVSEATLADIVVVAGAHPIGRELVGDAKLIECPQWADGPGASLRCGLAALDPEIGAAVIILADGPALDPRAIDRVVDAWRAGDGPVLAASYGADRSHPVLVDRSEWEKIPAEGGRVLCPSLVDCADLREPGDVDTEEDLARLGGNFPV